MEITNVAPELVLDIQKFEYKVVNFRCSFGNLLKIGFYAFILAC